jgi:hypothetical protein
MLPKQLIAALLIVSACSSRQPLTTTGRKVTSSNDKATLNPANTTLIEIDATVAYSPRRVEEIRESVLLHPGVLECLRRAPEVRETQFQVGVEGHLNYKGEAEDVQVVSPNPDLKKCLMREVSAVEFGRGRLGPFKMQIIRPQVGVSGGKPMLLDLSEGKKFE